MLLQMWTLQGKTWLVKVCEDLLACTSGIDSFTVQGLARGLHLQDGQFRAVAKSDVLELNAISPFAVCELDCIWSVLDLHQHDGLKQLCM